MTTLLNVTPDATKTETPAATPAAPAAPVKDAPKPRGARPPAKVVEKEVSNVKWIKLVRGGTYGYKRAIYEEGKTYEVDLPTAEHLLAQFYTLGNANETTDVYYFTEVKKK